MARPPKPTAVHILEGTFREDRHNAHDPMPAVNTPPCPDHLPELAKKEWDRIVPLLLEMQVLATVDMSTVAGYCLAYARWVEAELALTEQGTIVRSPNGYPIQNPFLSVSNKASADMRAYGSDLGLSPVSRTRIRVQKKTVNAGGVMKRNRA